MLTGTEFLGSEPELKAMPAKTMIVVIHRALKFDLLSSTDVCAAMRSANRACKGKVTAGLELQL